MSKPKEGLSPKLMLLTQTVRDSESWILDLLRSILADAFPAGPAYLSFLGPNLTHPTYPVAQYWGTGMALNLVWFFLCEAWTRGQKHSLQNQSSHLLYSTQLPSTSSSRFLLCVFHFSAFSITLPAHVQQVHLKFS